ncbi:MAG TPA: tetratricopeptide repeat protein [Planctomycetota bacterium]|nr:tetratricopeptide repeat protein [Planctomycetota bacterium]
MQTVARWLAMLCALGSWTECVAQDFAARLDLARESVAAKEWKEAREMLVGLQEQATTDEEREQLAVVLDDAGVGMSGDGQPIDALAMCQAALAIRKRLYSDRDHLDVAQSLNNVACCLRSLGHADEALRQHEAALAMRKRLYGDRDHPDTAQSLNNVAACLLSLGRAGEALPELESALAMRRRLYGDRDHPDVAGSLNNVAACLLSLSRADEALSNYESALAMERRLHGESDDPDVAQRLNNVAACLQSLGRASEALPKFESALAMYKRLCEDRDHPGVAQSLNNVACCLQSLGRTGEALPMLESALAMNKRIFGGRDHPDVAQGLNNVAACLQSLGRAGEALLTFESALAMRRRLYGDRDHPHVAQSLNSVAACLQSLGRAGEALPTFESALAMARRLSGDRDDPGVAASLNNVAACLESLGRAGEALPQYEAALAMRRRLSGDHDQPDVAGSLNNVAACLVSLGRAGEALPKFESALTMHRFLYGDHDHPAVATSLDNVASCLRSLGRAGEALPQCEAALAMRRRLSGDHDHPDVAASLNSVARCLRSLGRAGEALPQYEAALAMRTRLSGDHDHPDVAASLNNVASCLRSLGRAGEALPRFESSLAMCKRLYRDRDHPDVAASLNSVASCLQSLGRADEALPVVEQAVAMIERLRNHTRTSAELRQSFFEDLKQGGVFERLQHLAKQLGHPAKALHAAERSRGRELLDALEQYGDPEVEAQRRARLRGDEAAASRLLALRDEVEIARTEGDRLLHELTKLADVADAGDRDQQRASLLAQSNANGQQLRQLLDERARLLGDVLPVGRVCTALDIQSSLRAGELLLEFTVDPDGTLLYVVAHDGQVQVVDLPNAVATVRRELPELLGQASHRRLRGRDPDAGTAPASPEMGRELFTSLVPAPVWERIRASQRVFVAAHRELHRVPFELLVTEIKDGKPVCWLDSGPPIAYVPSGTLLRWLRKRSREASDDTTSLDLLAIGDPRRLDAEPEVPERGVFVVKVDESGEGARVGLQRGDVLTSYDGKLLEDDKALRDARMETERAIEDGRREKAPITIEVWRRGKGQRVDVAPGLLGIQVGLGRARLAHEASLSSDARMELVTRSGDLERIGRLPPLRGARAEIEAIEKTFAEHGAKARSLLGEDATEPAVFDLAAKAKYLHFACHGIAEEYAGRSLSMLVLSQPQHVLPGDDGLLKLGDLLNAWRGRLASCRLVVLSACRTEVGPTLRDEAPQALPIGFLFAGAPAVISSLWAVDDASTRELMTDFYGRLLAGETDRLAAFAAAKKALRVKYPDPFHWAPFLYIGAPE